MKSKKIPENNVLYTNTKGCHITKSRYVSIQGIKRDVRVLAYQSIPAKGKRLSMRCGNELCINRQHMQIVSKIYPIINKQKSKILSILSIGELKKVYNRQFGKYPDGRICIGLDNNDKPVTVSEKTVRSMIDD